MLMLLELCSIIRLVLYGTYDMKSVISFYFVLKSSVIILNPEVLLIGIFKVTESEFKAFRGTGTGTRCQVLELSSSRLKSERISNQVDLNRQLGQGLRRVNN